MADDKLFTAFCGLYCLDCIPCDKDFFQKIDELASLIEEHNIERYTELRSEADSSLGDFPRFMKTLHAIRGLECPAPCREGGGNPECAIRSCARGKGLDGCWECDERSDCSRLEPLEVFHGETIKDNLEAIRECGIDNWGERRGKHYPWS